MILLASAIMLLAICIVYMIFNLNAISILIKLNDREFYDYCKQREQAMAKFTTEILKDIGTYHEHQISAISLNFDDLLAKIEEKNTSVSVSGKRKPKSEEQKAAAAQKRKEWWAEKRRQEGAASLQDKLAAIQQLPPSEDA